MQVHRIPDVGDYFLFIFCLFAVHIPTPCIWVCLKMVYTLQMVIEFGDILSNNTWSGTLFADKLIHPQKMIGKIYLILSLPMTCLSYNTV
jgi:hypothetical protein